MRPKDTVRALVEAYNAKSLDGVTALYQPDATFWDPLHRDGVEGLETIRELVAALFAAYPDERMEIITLAGDDRNVVAEFRSTGTVVATGEAFQLDLTEVYSFRDGLIASCRVYLDPHALPASSLPIG
jgi:uncharacterized protein